MRRTESALALVRGDRRNQRTRAAADSLLSLAEDNLRFVEAGKGAHNIAYADELLRAALELVQQAVDDSSLPYSVPNVELGPTLGGNVCLQCHLDIGEHARRRQLHKGLQCRGKCDNHGNYQQHS